MKHINEYSKFRESLNEGVNLKASHLSSEDYQKLIGPGILNLNFMIR